MGNNLPTGTLPVGTISFQMAKYLEFGQWLSGEMKKRGWSQADLAKKADVSRATISRVISGTRNVGPDLCLSLAIALKVPAEEIFRIAGILPPEPNNEKAKDDPPGLGEWIWHYLQAGDEDRDELLEFARFKAQNRNTKSSELRRVGN